MGEVSQGSAFGEGGSEREGLVGGRDGVTVMRVLVAVVVAGVVVLARR